MIKGPVEAFTILYHTSPLAPSSGSHADTWDYNKSISWGIVSAKSFTFHYVLASKSFILTKILKVLALLFVFTTPSHNNTILGVIGGSPNMIYNDFPTPKTPNLLMILVKKHNQITVTKL